MKDCFTCVYLNGAGFCSRSACTYLSENDLVPVIRCKDCAKRTFTKCPMAIGRQSDYDFCSRAERKEDGTL